MLIGELARKTGLSVHTIRFYEKEGLLDSRYVRRGENNYRYYSEEAIERLTLIKQAQMTGFTLAELKELAVAYDAGELTSSRQHVFMQRKIDDLSQKITELERVRSQLISKLALIEHNHR